jgi:transcriptional regulator with XRE-family HTH domain
MKQPQLGQKIIELRKKKGLTQEQLVEKCNINVRTLQRIESGEVNPRSFTIKIIFDTLDYDINNESLIKKERFLNYIDNLIDRLNKQILKINQMKNSKKFLYNYFLAIGIIWFFCALSIVIFKLNFQVKEILLTLIIPLAFSIFRKFTNNNTSELSDKKED